MKKLVLALVALTAVAAWFILDDTAKPDNALLQDRVWIERIPKDQKDMILHLVVVEQQGHQPGGAFVRASRWRSLMDCFMWKKTSDGYDLGFPQAGKHTKAQIKTWRCEGKAPKPFQLCLELTAGERKIRLFSRDDWTVGSQEAPEFPSLPDDEIDDVDSLFATSASALPL